MAHFTLSLRCSHSVCFVRHLTRDPAGRPTPALGPEPTLFLQRSHLPAGPWCATLGRKPRKGSEYATSRLTSTVLQHIWTCGRPKSRDPPAPLIAGTLMLNTKQCELIELVGGGGLLLAPQVWRGRQRDRLCQGQAMAIEYR
jgi:hypothetical protein